MCKYCESKLKRPVELMDNFPIMYSNSNKKIDGEEGPVQYIRRRFRGYSLVTEIGDYDTPFTESIIECKILFCPLCGRKLN